MTLDELMEIRPVDPEIIRKGVEEMKTEARLYQLKELRKELGLTQVQLAERLGVSQHRVSQIENGDLSVRVDTLKKYFEALGTSLTISVESPLTGRASRFSPAPRALADMVTQDMEGEKLDLLQDSEEFDRAVAEDSAYRSQFWVISMPKSA